ncbi:MAG: TonB-dependent receptor [Candidatus Firestonebacteria bacterium]|nr:TonB-dependent receptor [Candidatus Firestonebacteria bacterium]
MKNINLSKKLFILIICSLFISTESVLFAQNTYSILSIRVLDKTTDTPLKNAFVEINKTKTKIKTDENGNAVLNDIIPGKYELKISMIGYKTKIENIEIMPGEKKEVLLKLELAVIITGKEVVIAKEKNEIVKKEEISMQTVKAENIKKSAGALEDAFKVIHTLPGVIKEADFSAAMYVRGGEREQNLVLIDRLYAGNPYHMGGFTSLVNPDIIEKIDFYAGGMAAEGGQSLSSVIDITTQEGNSEKTKGIMDVSLMTFKLKLDGPFDKIKGNWLLSLRRSYYDLLLKAIGQKNVAVPNYGDYLEKFVSNPNSQNHLTFLFFQTLDDLKADVEENEDAKNKTDFKKFIYNDFQDVFSMDWKYLATGNFYIQSTIANNREKIDVERTASVSPEMHRYDYYTNTLRQDYTFILPEGHEFKTGLYLSNTDMDLKARYRYYTNTKQGATQDLNYQDLNYEYRTVEENNIGRYNGYFVQDTWKTLDTTLTIRYGARAEYFSITDKWAYSPRLMFNYNINKNTILKSAWGQYSQFPVDFIRTSKDEGNPDLKPERADHYIFGFEHLFDKDTMGRAEIYYKDYSQLITKETSDLKYSNNGKGFSKGVDLFLQRKETRKINGWITYTYCIAKRKYNETEGWIYPSHDQRHTIAIVGNYEYSPKWTYSWTWYINTGKPYTPIISREYDTALQRWIPQEGGTNSDRFPLYHRLDFKIARHFEKKRTETTAYLDIINFYNAKNVFDYSWNEDYTKKEEIYSLPFIPFLGVEVKF